MNNPIERTAAEAIMNRMWSHTVGIVNEKKRIRTLADGRPLHEEQPGTASLIRWKEHYGVLTARHVVEDATNRDLRFFFRPAGHLEHLTREEIEKRKYIEANMGERADIREIVRCDWEDIAILIFNEEPRSLTGEFHEIGPSWRDPGNGETIYCFGFPSHNALPLNKTRSPEVEEHIHGLTSFAWSSKVISKPETLVESVFTEHPFDPDKHFFVEWSVADETMGMHGFSGAAIWIETPFIAPALWSPRLLFAGMCTHYYDRAKIGRMIRASVLRSFLEDVFGPA